MSNLRTLKELGDLKNSRFGRPYPRHGLKLLYWFANDFLFFNNNNKMCWQYNPKYQFYGFHRFMNRMDKNGVQLLPDANLSYYAVGNLNSAGADELPGYVREDYGDFQIGNNMDRIIVSTGDHQCIERVYVTQHSDRTDFNNEATYCISDALIMIIRELTLEDFLLKTGYSSSVLDYAQGAGVSRTQENTDRSAGKDKITNFWDSRSKPGHRQSSGVSGPQENTDQSAGEDEVNDFCDSRSKPGHGQSSGVSGPQENTDQSAGEDEVNDFWEDNESTTCCRCVIL